MAETYDKIAGALISAGLTPRGAFHPRETDDVPDVRSGTATATLVLAGNAGPDMWRAFADTSDPKVDRLDDWSRTVVTEVANKLDARALFPFDKPHLPFQRWASLAEPCYPSPLSMFVHPDYGLWHGYRGALAFADTIELPAPDMRPSPCDDCADKPCLSTFPVSAFNPDGYDVPACVGHLRGVAGRPCMEGGCIARHACPIGQSFRYGLPQAQFHMRAFYAVLTEEQEI